MFVSSLHEFPENCVYRAPTTFKLEGKVTPLSESSQGEVADNREKWGDFWEVNLRTLTERHVITFRKKLRCLLYLPVWAILMKLGEIIDPSDRDVTLPKFSK
jgi:hypothetical protein